MRKARRTTEEIEAAKAMHDEIFGSSTKWRGNIPAPGVYETVPVKQPGDGRDG